MDSLGMESGGRNGCSVLVFVERLCWNSFLDRLQPAEVILRFRCVDEDPRTHLWHEGGCLHLPYDKLYAMNTKVRLGEPERVPVHVPQEAINLFVIVSPGG